jgi:hypothetical protein
MSASEREYDEERRAHRRSRRRLLQLAAAGGYLFSATVRHPVQVT